MGTVEQIVAPNVEHVAEVVYCPERTLPYHAECVCGWYGQGWTTQLAARENGANHVRFVDMKLDLSQVVTA